MENNEYRTQVTQLVRQKILDDRRTVFDIAKSTGVAFGTIQKLSKGGTRACHHETMKRLAAYYGIPYEPNGGLHRKEAVEAPPDFSLLDHVTLNKAVVATTRDGDTIALPQGTTLEVHRQKGSDVYVSEIRISYGRPYTINAAALAGALTEADRDRVAVGGAAGVTMSTGDAARYLGLTKQTIRNLIDRGVLRTAMLGRNDIGYVMREDVEALLPGTRDLSDADRHVESLTRQLCVIGRATEKDILRAQRCREAFMDRHYGIRNVAAASEAWEAMYDGLMEAFGEDAPLSERDREILRCNILGRSFDELEDIYGVSKERIRQIAQRSRIQMKHIGDSIRRLKARHDALEKENAALRRRVADLESGHVEDKTGEEPSPMARKGYTLDTNLEDCQLSVRTRNCCHCAKVRTIRDLVQLDKTDLLRWRNFGKKSLREIYEFLDSLGLSLGMRA